MVKPIIILSDEEKKLFKEVHEEISESLSSMMNDLWSNWTHLGIPKETKITNIRTLVTHEKILHKEIITETEKKLMQLKEKLARLKEEAAELSQCLSVDITLLEYAEDMPLIEYKNALEEQLAKYRKEAEQRRKLMDMILEWQRDLADKLGVTIDELQEKPLPAKEELSQLVSHLEELQAESDKRGKLFLNTQIKIKDIMTELQIKPQNTFERIAASSKSKDFKVTDQNMERLAMLLQDLEEKYEQTNNRVSELRERLPRLWDCLEEDQMHRENFMQAHTGCNPQTELAIKEEIERCDDQIRREKIPMFVANVRTKIKLTWDSLMYSQAQRDEFVHYNLDIFTEDTLTQHEEYLVKISKIYEETKPIFDLVQTRKALWNKMTDLEARASEPNRFKNRGGQLLQEEKERKKVAIKLPKIEQQIKDLVLKYEAKTETVFTVEGKPLLQLIHDDWDERKVERKNRLSARKQARTPSPQLLRALDPSPLGGCKSATAAAALTNKSSSKRHLNTGSGTKAMNAASSDLPATKKSAVLGVKRRTSGRLAAKAMVDSKTDRHKRVVTYNASYENTSQPRANGSILKHKRMSRRRRSVTISRDTGNPL